MRDGATPEYLRDWARHAGSSPLYVELTEVIANDPDLLELLGSMENTPRPNVLLAGVQYLLMSGHSTELAEFYPSLTPAPRPREEVGTVFRAFSLEHRDQLIEIGASRYTQTNECRRCVALLPMIWASGFEVFHLVDLGTSAGLNLALDRYSYRWDEVSWGSGEVVLVTQLRGAAPSPRPIEILSRTGLDLNPIDPRSESDRVWLDALIWPEHEDRRRRLRLAMATLAGLETRLVGGDAIETLPVVLDSLPGEEPVVVMNSFVMIQMSIGQREAIEQISASARSQRPLLRVSMEIEIEGSAGASLVIDDGSGTRSLGSAQPHGEWLELGQALP